MSGKESIRFGVQIRKILLVSVLISFDTKDNYVLTPVKHVSIVVTIKFDCLLSG